MASTTRLALSGTIVARTDHAAARARDQALDDAGLRRRDHQPLGTVGRFLHRLGDLGQFVADPAHFLDGGVVGGGVQFNEVGFGLVQGFPGEPDLSLDVGDVAFGLGEGLLALKIEKPRDQPFRDQFAPHLHRFLGQLESALQVLEAAPQGSQLLAALLDAGFQDLLLAALGLALEPEDRGLVAN
ncbi:MAG: hypothetical protein OEO83_08755 [Alphaproteobacteria bacterium]|nr:hypothetical protein [Alphaproteobacteria bacterium]